MSKDYTSVLNFIVAYKTRHDGNSPSIREIMSGCGFKSTSSTSYAIHSLEDDGLLRASDAAARGIEVVGGEWRMK